MCLNGIRIQAFGCVEGVLDSISSISDRFFDMILKYIGLFQYFLHDLADIINSMV